MRRITGGVLALALCAGCSKSPTQPGTSTPPAPGPGPSAAPVAALQVKVDDGIARDAIASLSDIVADASGSTGSGALTFAVDFGDGSAAATASARHTYAAPGTYTIVVTVTDAQGQKASTSSTITVKAVTGRWFQAQYVDRSRRVEVRRLTLATQDGTSVRGTYDVTGDAERSVTGTLVPPRNIRLTMSGGAMLEGVVPDRLEDPAGRWALSSSGDTLNGRLEFRAVVGEPAGPPPDAVIRVTWDDARLSAPIVGLTPVQIDGTRSHGTGLSYFLEFGDGFVSTAATATHVLAIGAGGLQPARLTVVDAFGRTDTETTVSYVVRLTNYGAGFAGHDSAGPTWLRFDSASGATLSGAVRRGTSFADASATLSGTRDVRLVVPAWNAEFRGTLDEPQRFQVTMTLLQVSGEGAGRTFVLIYQDPY